MVGIRKRGLRLIKETGVIRVKEVKVYRCGKKIKRVLLKESKEDRCGKNKS